MGSWTSRTSMIRPQKRRGKDATADGSELGNLGWIQAAPSLTAHFPRPPPRCRRRVPSALVERLRGLSCHPGRPQGPRPRPPQPPTVSTPFSGRSSASSAWVRQSRARRAFRATDCRGAAAKPRTGTPALGNPRGPEGSLWLAAGWGVIPRLPGDSPKGKDPTQRERERERDGRAVRTWGCGLGQRATRQVRRALDPRNRAGDGFVQKAAEITQRCEDCWGSERDMIPLVAEGAIWTEPTGKRSRDRAEGVELRGRRWRTRALDSEALSPPRAPRGSGHLHQAQDAQWWSPARSSGASRQRHGRGSRMPGLARYWGRAGAGRVEQGLESQLPPQPWPLLWRGRSQAPDFSFIPSHSFVRPAPDWLYLV